MYGIKSRELNIERAVSARLFSHSLCFHRRKSTSPSIESSMRRISTNFRRTNARREDFLPMPRSFDKKTGRTVSERTVRPLSADGDEETMTRRGGRMKRMSTCTLTYVPSVGNEVDDRCDSINKKNIEADRALSSMPPWLACVSL